MAREAALKEKEVQMMAKLEARDKEREVREQDRREKVREEAAKKQQDETNMLIQLLKNAMAKSQAPTPTPEKPSASVDEPRSPPLAFPLFRGCHVAMWLARTMASSPWEEPWAVGTCTT